MCNISNRSVSIDDDRITLYFRVFVFFPPEVTYGKQTGLDLSRNTYLFMCFLYATQSKQTKNK